MRKMKLVTCDIGTFCILHQCSPDTLLSDGTSSGSLKTPRLHDGQGELTTAGLEVMQVLLAAGGKVEELEVNL
jgi:hypothetical protein